MTKQGHSITGIEKFLSQEKRHLRHFNGLTPNSFYWFLMECEWHFNDSNHPQLFKQLKYWHKSANL